MQLSQCILFAIVGCWVTLADTPALSNEPMGQAEIRAKKQTKRQQRKSRSPLRSSRNDDDIPPQVNGRSAGSRGCVVETATATATATRELRDRLPALMLLAPLDSIAQTQSTQPLLAWYLRDNSPNPFIFRLYEIEDGFSAESLNDPQQAWKLMAEVTLPSKDKRINSLGQHSAMALEGISTLELSMLPEPVKLRAGGHYVWQIEVICDPERPSRNLFAQAALKMVAPSQSSLTQSKAAVLDELLKQRLWQDALAISLQKSGTSLHSSAQRILESVVISNEELEAIQQATIRHEVTREAL